MGAWARLRKGRRRRRRMGNFRGSDEENVVRCIVGMSLVGRKYNESSGFWIKKIPLQTGWQEDSLIF
jgi:hypothetical protein